MNFKIKILKKLREQLALEELSRDTYYAFLKKIDNKKINSDIAGIYNQEIEHIKIVNEMVDILSKYKIPIKETKKEIKERRETNLTLKGEIILLLIYKTEDYIHKFISFLIQLNERKMIYISYNKIPKYIKKVLKEHKFDVKKIVFINGVDIKSDEDINIRPEDLTKLSIIINETAKKLKNVTVVVDTISAFSTYHNDKTICQFVASMNDRERNEGYGIVWVAIDEPAERPLNLKLSQICDKTIKKRDAS